MLSGAYIGVDAIEGKGSKATKLTFEGLEIRAVTHDRTGKRFKLKADNLGSLDVGSPVYYRRINVGRVIGTSSTKSGDSVNIEVRRRAERCVQTSGTRFWNSRQFSHAWSGCARTRTVVSLLGGVAFEPVYTRAATAGAG